MFQNFVSQGEVSYAVETNRAIAPVLQKGGLFMRSVKEGESVCCPTRTTLRKDTT